MQTLHTIIQIFTIPNKIINIYKHFTYFGSIISSLIVIVCLPYLSSCGDNIHRLLSQILSLKCFFLYNSTLLELIHHIITFKLNMIIKPINIVYCDDNILNAIYISHAILITPIFNNIKFYMKDKKIKNILNLLTFISFFYYRGKFNYYYWFSNGLEIIDRYIMLNTTKTRILYDIIICRLIINIICLMNVYWSYKIIQIIIKKKYLKF